MSQINAAEFGYRELNEEIRKADSNCEVVGALGQRFIAAGMDGKNITITGTPGNALGAYLNGANITVQGNAQDAVGDTMNAGTIVIHGNVGDTAGYAMRGGQIYVRGNAGYRSGIHMKAYKDKLPVMVVGGRTGSFLGEYQAGGYIIVLGLHEDGKPIVGNFPSTGMHGGKLFLRGTCEDISFPTQVTARPATPEDLSLIEDYIRTFAQHFNLDSTELLQSPYTVVTPDSSNPYTQMYVAN